MDSLRQCWQTPDDFWNVVDEEFNFDIDVAATDHNTRCVNYITPEMNAFRLEWWDNAFGPLRSAWCNPGFTNMEPWIDEAIKQTAATPGVVACVLGLVAPSTKWWLKASVTAVEIRLLSPRIQFTPPPGIKRSSNARENALFVFRRKPCWPVQLAQHAHIWTWRWKA